jgi:glycosyltransferase involved in cell wall biosynthesis
MHIIQTPARFHPYIGGVENHVWSISRELVRKGHNVSVFCADEPHVVPSEADIDGIRVVRIPYPMKIANTNITPRLPALLAAEEFDLIHTHIPTPWSADASAMVAWRKHKPLIVTYHNDLTGTGAARYLAGAYNRTFLKKVLQLANRIIVTQPNYTCYSRVLQPYDYKIEVVPNGVDTERFKPSENGGDANTIFFLSALDQYHEYKGLHVLLDAMPLVKKEVPDVKLMVGGSGNLLGAYKDRAWKLQLNGSVYFLGGVPEDRLPEYYASASCFVLPSFSSAQEGFGMVLLEAMASGTPVVCTPIAGVAADVSEYDAGLVVPPESPRELADALIYLLANEADAKAKGRNGRNLVEAKYTWALVADRVDELYREVPRT